MPETPASADFTAVQPPKPSRPRHDRSWRAERFMAVQEAVNEGQSLRSAAADADVARSTVRHWQKSAAPATAAFFETPAGLELLRSVLVGAHWAIAIRGGGGIRLVCEFLEMTGLSEFIAASWGTQQGVHVALEEAIFSCVKELQAELAQDMPVRRMVLVQDETWKDGMRLVAMDAVSRFIWVEKAAESRSAETWTQVVQQSLAGLKVEIVQCVSDQAPGLLSHAKRDLGVHHTPELFHVQHELSKGMSLALSRAEQQAERDEQAAHQRWEAEQERKKAYWTNPRKPGRPHNFDRRIAEARQEHLRASAAHQEMKDLRAESKALIGALSEDWHPYDLQQGKPQTPEQCEEKLEKSFNRLDEIATHADLPEKSHRHVGKARRVLPEMVASIVFFFVMIAQHLKPLGLCATVEQAVRDALIPALYLEWVSRQHPDADERRRLRALSARLLAPLQQADHPIQSLSAEKREQIVQVATECAHFFQRSSSCVEGRNGQLALHQHAHHRLGPRKQAVLTAIHNFGRSDADGTTAAERFFAKAHPSLFKMVLNRMPWPARPAKRRWRPPEKTSPLAVAESAAA
jgi:hypothetical protein